MKTKILIIAFMAIITPKLLGQDTIEQIQPTIMVMPFTKSGQNALDLFENDFKWQSIIARVNNAFQERGFRPKDLQETINQVKKTKAISSLKNANFNVEEAIYMEARTDIIVKAFINIFSEDGINNSVQVSLKAIETSSRMSLYDLPTATSPPFKTTDYGYLVDRILTEENRIEKFIDGLNEAFKQIVDLGKAITIEIMVTEDSLFKLDDEIGEDADFISELITDWVKQNANKNQYRIKQDSENILSFDEVRIPLRTESGNNYSINDFAKSISKAIAKICSQKEGIKAKRRRASVSEGTIRIILP
ncbi:DUF6175 family protein [uncultured Polaribacter sp.]|uniref:DUF6175 family protein n=1 Tax=uncultured Polaribacter sp. TaxID=174711 RepID=UPI002609ABCF|nr:DUF6175 family protein [uncultured Polaribacter sp.]